MTVRRKRRDSSAQALTVVKRLDYYGQQTGANSLYQRRVAANIRGEARRARIDGAWRAILIAILTTQQRSTGKDKKRLTRAIQSLRWCDVNNNPRLIKRYITGFHYNDKKLKRIKNARRWLNDKSNWKRLRKFQRQIGRIPVDVDNYRERYDTEKSAADFLRELDGIGPKQGRNFWQYRGYSVWTIPLDSRVKNILSEPPFSRDTSRRYEDLELDVVELCKEAGTYPCLLDALLFDLEALMRGLVGLPPA